MGPRVYFDGITVMEVEAVVVCVVLEFVLLGMENIGPNRDGAICLMLLGEFFACMLDMVVFMLPFEGACTVIEELVILCAGCCVEGLPE